MAALKAEREKLRRERDVLRVAVKASFKDAAAKDREREDARRTVATQACTAFFFVCLPSRFYASPVCFPAE